MILVPFERLPGGHQTKNAEKLQEVGAVVMIPNEKLVQQSSILLDEVRHLVRSPRERENLAEKLHAEAARPEAAKDLADIILELGEKKDKK